MHQLPKNSRRSFLKKSAALTACSTLVSASLACSLEEALQSTAHISAAQLASDETFWRQIRQAYTVSATMVNLNNGGVSPQPRVVQEAVEYYNRKSNETPTVYMRRVIELERKVVKEKLARLAGCGVDEIVIHRNATESLENIIFGIPLQRGDEVILSRQDYPAMVHSWEQRALREGIVLKYIDWTFPVTDPDFMVRQFTQFFNKKTKLIQITHVVNWNGQIMPVAAIARAAKQSGIEVLVDGAHSFAQFAFTIPNLECDYFGTSLHKWLSAPFGTGMLYVKKDKIKNLWPLFGSETPRSANIEKMEAIGTRSQAIETAIAHAIDFYELIGAERKFARLLFLKKYWLDQLRDIPGFKLWGSEEAGQHSAIGLFTLEGRDTYNLFEYLMREQRVHVAYVDWAGLRGIRVTPNVYTLVEELDRFCAGVRGFVG